MPGDVLVSGSDSTRVAETAWPRPATLHAPLQNMRAEAVNLPLAQAHLVGPRPVRPSACAT